MPPLNQERSRPGKQTSITGQHHGHSGQPPAFQDARSLLLVFASSLLIPTVGSVIWDEQEPSHDIGLVSIPVTTASYLISAAIIVALGFALTRIGSKNRAEMSEWDALYLVGAGWLFCAVLGAMPFLLSGVTRDPSVALFESMSGITTTGFSAFDAPLEQYPPSIHVWRATLQFVGGMGLVVIAVAVISRLTEGGRRLMAGETGRQDVQIHTRIRHTARALFMIYLALNAAFFIFFWIAIARSGYSLSDAAFHALVHTFAGIATGGYSSLTNSIAGFESTLVMLVAMGSMVAGGFSFPILLRLGHGEWRRVLRMDVVRFYIAMLILPAVWVTWRLLEAGFSWSQALVHGPFMSISSLVGEGFTTLDVGTFPAEARMTMLFLMVTGGMVGSTSGAVKQARILVFMRLMMAEYRRIIHPRSLAQIRVGGQRIATQQVMRTASFFLAYLIALMAGTFAFAALGFDIESAAAGAFSTLGNVGYAWEGFAGGYAEPIGPLARTIGIILMWFGRLEIFAALVVFLPVTYRSYHRHAAS